jgi:cell division protein FtsB
MTKKKQHKDLQTTWKTISTIVSVAIAIFCAGFWAGWYIHGNVSSVEFHEKEMQLYNLHRQIDEGYKNEIRQLEAEKRILEKEIYELRKESLKRK